jgi:PAS domain S-box-containing protein
VTVSERFVMSKERLDRELTLARELAIGIGSAESVEDALELTLLKICDATGWQLGEAWVRKGDELELSTAWHRSGALDRFASGLSGTRTKHGVGLPGLAWESGRPVWMRDLASDSRFLRTSLARKFGLTAAMAVPVLSGEDVAAVLVFFVSEPREDDEQLIDLVSVVAAQLGSLLRRKQAEQDQRRSEQQLRAIADTAVDAIVFADSSGVLGYVNQSAARIFGYTREQMLGQPLTLLMPQRFQAAHVRGLNRFLETGESHIIGRRVELTGRRKNGDEFPVELALSAWTSDGQSFFTGVLRDITERRRSEESMRQSDALKTALLRAVSHDLRSPLTAIVAAGETSASPGISLEGRRELASVIVSEATRLSRLVDKLLDLSRLQGGAAAPRQVSCSVEELIDTALEQLHDVEYGFQVQIGDDLPGVMADAMQLERALVNLFENASRFCGGEPVRVSVTAEPSTLLVRVSDRGPGIAEDDLERIFEPFYRASDQPAGHPGSGLGLAIVKGFVEANGGRVWVESQLGQGTSFVIQLPVDADSGEASRAEPSR